MTNPWKIPDFVGWISPIFFREINYPLSLYRLYARQYWIIYWNFCHGFSYYFSHCIFRFDQPRKVSGISHCCGVLDWIDIVWNYFFGSFSWNVSGIFFWKIYLFYFFRNFHLIILFFLSLALSGSKTLVWQFAKIGIRQFTVGRCPNRSLHLFSFLHNWLFLRNARSFNVLFGFPGNPRANYIANRFHFGCFQVRHLPLKNKIGSVHAK